VECHEFSIYVALPSLSLCTIKFYNLFVGQPLEGMEGMLETLVEIYTDVFYEVKEDYLKKLEKIRKEGDFETISGIEDLRRLK